MCCNNVLTASNTRAIRRQREFAMTRLKKNHKSLKSSWIFILVLSLATFDGALAGVEIVCKQKGPAQQRDGTPTCRNCKHLVIDCADKFVVASAIKDAAAALARSQDPWVQSFAGKCRKSFSTVMNWKDWSASWGQAYLVPCNVGLMNISN